MNLLIPMLPWSRLTMLAAIGFACASLFVLPPALVVALAIIAFMFFVGASAPAIGLGIIAATIPVQDAVTFGFGAGSVPLTRLALLPFLAGWLVRWLNRDAEIRLTAPVLAWFLVVTALVVSIPAAIDRTAWAEEVYRWGAAFALYVVACDAMRSTRSCRPYIMGTIAGMSIATGVGIWQIATSAGPASFQARGLTRVYALFGEPNPLAGYLEMTVPLLIALSIPWVLRQWTSHPMFGRSAMVVIFLAGGFGAMTLVLTQSRGGLLGFAAAMLVVGLLSGHRVRLVTLAGVLVIAIVVMVTPPGRATANRLVASVAVVNSRDEVTIDNWSVQERVAHWRAGLVMLREHPWSGVGAGNFNERYRESTQVWRFRIPRGHAHNNVIQMGAQSGYTGLIAYLALLFTVGVRILRGIRSATEPGARALAVGACGVLAALLVHGQFDYLHGLSLSLALALAFACAEPAAASLSAARERSIAS